MAKDTSIEWTDHTFNPWWGCVEVSPACDHCYAKSWAKRVGQDVWGHKSRRRFFSDAHWSEPLRWNREAAATGQRNRVFCASMADVFEDRRDLDSQRERLWSLIAQTPHLDWQLLTKRPEAIRRLQPWGERWPSNVWIGTTVEDQTRAQLRVPTLLKIPAHVRFLSCEPLLGRLDLSPFIKNDGALHWIIAGGESGSGARPMAPNWARQLRDFSRANDIAFHFKQWGHWAPQRPDAGKKSETIVEGVVLYGFGKKQAGRRLDGRVWNQLPARPVDGRTNAAVRSR